MKILNIITSLEDGGAENTLYKICKYDSGNEIIVISLKGTGKYFSLLKKIGIKVYCLDMKYYSIIKFYSLIKLINLLNPDVVQTWLPHGDFLGGIASRLAGINKVIWNIRYSSLKNRAVKLKTIFLINILSKLSYIVPKKIIVNSKSGLKNCKDLRYCNYKLTLIHNGYDLLNFKQDKKKNFIRKKFKIDKNAHLIGFVARYDRTKDHQNLLNALFLVKNKNINFFCVLIGQNIKNKILAKEINRLGLSNYVKLIDKSKNIFNYLRALDIHVISSKTEGFPNVVAEAMACGTPCVVTDVGDSALIVGKTGWIVPPNNSIKLANTIEKALSEIGKNNWEKKCNLARLRVKKNFEISKMIKSYNKVWSKVNNKK